MHRLPANTWIPFAAVLGAALAGCGGGGYGGGGYGNPPPMPTVSIAMPSMTETIRLGQGLIVSWTSTNSMSCAASASAAAAGNFSGNLATSDSVEVAPTATGNFTYTVTCSGSGGNAAATSPVVTVMPSILSSLATMATIGSTVDPLEHGGNPYGLAIAPVSAGLVTAGDLIACNFNDGATNTQGAGTTIVGLHAAAGSTPYRIAQSASLGGCNALAVFPDGSISAAAFTANANPLVSTAGSVGTPFSITGGFGGPWGQVYIPATAPGGAALYLSNVGGSITRITLNGDAQAGSAEIVSGFCGSGVPGAIFAPAGLTYDASIDTLYVVDTSSNSVIALDNVSAIGAGGVAVNGQCMSVASPPTPQPTFSGTSAGSARVIAHGGLLIAPISAALLSDGDLVVGNGDINIATGQMPNLLFEISPVLPGGFVGSPVQLDTSGTPGALFGLATAVDNQGNDLVYFNDDNTNLVMRLSH